MKKVSIYFCNESNENQSLLITKESTLIVTLSSHSKSVIPLIIRRGRTASICPIRKLALRVIGSYNLDLLARRSSTYIVYHYILFDDGMD